MYITKYHINLYKKVKNTLVILITEGFSKISSIISGNIKVKIARLKEITEFNRSYQTDFEIFLKDLIQKKILPDFYSNDLSRMIGEVAKLKHLSNVVSLVCEMGRRIDDKYEFTNIDLEIESRPDCIHSYRIHVVI